MADFDAIYREFQPKIERYLGRLVGENDALDLTQAVFLKVSRGLADFRGEASLSTWIYRIATNTARDFAAAARARTGRSEELCDDPELWDDLPDPDPVGIEQGQIRREMNDCIRGVVAGLPENYRAVLLLGEFEELTNAEIAEILGLSPGTVKIRLHRGRAALRQALESACTFYHDGRSELMCDRKPK